jgi:TonB family protein
MKKNKILITLLLISLLGCLDNNDIKIETVKASKEFKKLPHLLINLREDYDEIFNEIEKKVKNSGLEIFADQRYQIIVDVNKKGRFNKVMIIEGEEKVVKIVVDELAKNSKQLLDMNKLPGSFQFTFWFDKTQRIWYEKGMVYYPPFDSFPTPVGGMISIQKLIQYPESAKNNGIQGTVVISAEIDEKGNVTKTKILEGIYPDCDEVAVNAIKQVKFNPAIRNNLPVKSEVVIPVSFKLEEKLTIENVLNKLKWRIPQAEVFKVASNYLKLTDYRELKQKDSRTRVIQFTGGSIYGIKTLNWSFTFDNDSLELISVEFKSNSSSDKSKTYTALKNEIEKISLTKIEQQPNKWILSLDNKTLARLQIYPGGRTTDVQILLSSN